LRNHYVTYTFVTNLLRLCDPKMTRRDVFQAIADPTRREIIGLIARQPMNLNAVADQFSITRPAISRHMKILRECGLITIKRQGRERVCEAKLQQLAEVAAFIEQYRVFWNTKLDALDKFLKAPK
jgi:DNA-binding transcriptional ArsR family regulator